ncbi:MAG: PPC domain-containing protein [Armatimonadetes bacterium]|nr:PPC domain-containing protein [Armatimonadota bacterium]
MKKLLFALGVVAASSSAFAVYEVHLDWLGSESQFDAAWTAAGYGAGDALTASDHVFLQHTTETHLEAIFAPFGVDFKISAPAIPHETLVYGATTGSSGTFGVADEIDWRNKTPDNSARIFSGNFGIIMSSTAFSRVENLERFAHALAGTGAHELLHNHGLQHYDAFGQPDIRANNGYADVAGQQNDSIMATGSTGLSLLRRGMPRFMNPLEMVKFEFAMGVTPTPGVTISEAGGFNGSIASAQNVLGSMLAVSGVPALNIDGNLSSSGDEDFFKFEATAGSLITANTFSALTELDTVDTFLTLYDSAGSVLFTNDDIQYTSSAFGTGSYSNDSIILNWEAQYTGTYYLEVGATAGSGDYELLLVGIDAVPEPATMIGLASLGLLALRRRKK